MKTSQFEQVIKENFPKVASLKSVNRKGKLYLVVKLNETDWMGGFDYFQDIRAALKDYFPSIYMTSGGGGSATFRLNGKIL